MTWSEAGYPSEQTDNPQNKVEGQSDKVYNTTDFLSKFEGNQNSIVSSCMQEIQSDTQLKEGFDNLLKSGISNDFINKIKQELKDNAELDEETLKILVQSIIAESITDFKIGSTGTIEGSTTQKVQNEAAAVQNEAAAVQNEAAAVQNEAAAVQNEGKVDIQQVRNDAMIARVNLLASLSDQKKAEEIDKKTKEKAELAQQQIPEETRNQLKEKGYDDKFINDYILLRVTVNEVRGNPDFDENQVAQFERSVNELSTLDVILKRLDNVCNIPDLKQSSFSSRNIAQTRTELFNDEPGVGNESLIEAKNSNLKSRDYSEMFPELGADDIISKYGKFLEGNLKEFWAKYQYNSEIKNKINELKNSPTISEEDRKLLQNYQIMLSEVKKIKEDADNKTKNMVEELCIISQIKGMYMCMGKSADFELNKAREIESENGILTLNGHIDGVEFAIRQNTNDPEARLQTSKKIAKSPDGNTFTIGGLNNFTDSNFILPSQQEIFETITETVTSGVSIENFDNTDKYLENLQLSIMGVMDKKYEKTKYVHHYMKNQVKGEKVVDSSLGLLKKIKPDIYVDLDRPINVVSNEKLFNFIKMLNFNIENSTDNEKDKLNKCIAKILQITENYRNNNGIQTFDTFKYPPIIENYLKNQNWLSGGMENSRLSSVFDMLSYYNQNSKNTRANKEGTDGVPSKIFINDLYRDLFEFTGGQSVTGVKRQNESLEKSDKEEADELLKGIEDM